MDKVSSNAYSELLGLEKEITILEQIMGQLYWDKSTYLPKDGIESRTKQLTLLVEIKHKKITNPRIQELLDKIDVKQLNQEQAANILLIKRSYKAATKIPLSLSKELCYLQNICYEVWKEARKTNDLTNYLPLLNKIIHCSKEVAKCLQEDQTNLYDVMLEDYEYGIKIEQLNPLFTNLRNGIQKILSNVNPKFLNINKNLGKVISTKQMQLSMKVAKAFGYNFNAGRIDLTTHPFSTGHRTDSRVTTRIDEYNIIDCLYSTIHEVGHSNYTQGTPSKWDYTPIGSYASMGVHESQSRILENQFGRSAAFISWLHPEIQKVQNDPFDGNAEELYYLINQVSPSFIRTESDELHYNLHIILRYEIEQMLINDDLKVDDLEEVWNTKFYEFFNKKVDKLENGLLQDVHWSGGSFGYFPTYSLGNIYAGELYNLIKSDLPNIDKDLKNADLKDINNWLGKNIHQAGSLYKGYELITKVLKRKPNEKALLKYLEEKFCD